MSTALGVCWSGAILPEDLAKQGPALGPWGVDSQGQPRVSRMECFNGRWTLSILTWGSFLPSRTGD